MCSAVKDGLWCNHGQYGVALKLEKSMHVVKQFIKKHTNKSSYTVKIIMQNISIFKNNHEMIVSQMTKDTPSQAQFFYLP